ncbi:MAG: insulinase family protein [Gammaproteobacteria bacterium]|nr:insulinase family protein [Gammaproteobacteria bacterium]
MSTTVADRQAIDLGFEWLRSEDIESLNVTVEEYRHSVTGALHYHIASDSPENVFLVALRTVPMDSTGVAHMLEHTVLCGSERYPVRDPFFMMIRRSLNTFMNAFTSSDWTAYPFASQNRKDFFNLLDVYLDSVFFSRLHELDFLQEGHRVEFESADDASSKLVYKGVVFNEMKGAMSSVTSTLWHTLTKYLYPSTTYHYNSGGDPEHITDLSYSDLKSFYQSHYHPSNAVFMTYGDIPASQHQVIFQDRVLSRFEHLDHNISVADEKRYFSPIVVEESYPLSADEAEGDRTHIVLAWLLGNSTKLEDVLRANLLSSLLLDDSASPLRRALETTDLAGSPSPLCGLEDSNREMAFVCGVEGAKPESAQAVEDLVLSVLKEVADKGIEQDRIEAVLHQLELGQREVGGDGFPYGLQLMLEGLSSAVHGGDPVAMLNLDPALEKLREEIKAPDFVSRLIDDHLLNNAHRVRLTLKPDAQLIQRRDQAQEQKLEKVKQALTATQQSNVIDMAAKLAQRQSQEDDPGILPKVGIEDVPASIHIPQGEQLKIDSAALRYYSQGTNGIVYQEIVTALPDLSTEELAILPYYSALLPELGCGELDYLAAQIWQSKVSGGVSAYSTIRGATDDAANTKGYLVMSGKALVRHHAELTQLLKQSFLAARFDETSRIRELMSQMRLRREQGVVGSGHSLAMTAASAAFSPIANLQHTMRGLVGLSNLKALDDSLNDNKALNTLSEQLTTLHQKIAASPRQFLLVGEAEQRDVLLDALSSQWQGVANARQAAHSVLAVALPEKTSLETRGEFWLTNTQVNFCARAYQAVAIAHDDAAALSVLSGFMRNGYLHTAVREQGGAYGGGASYDPDSATFRFYSYRDPRLVETLDDFDKAIDWVLQNNHDERQLEEAILGVIGSIDKPGSPAGEAKSTFHAELFDRDAAFRQQTRARILDVTLSDLKRVAQTYLDPEKSVTAVITHADNTGLASDLGYNTRKL